MTKPITDETLAEWEPLATGEAAIEPRYWCPVMLALIAEVRRLRTAQKGQPGTLRVLDEEGTVLIVADRSRLMPSSGEYRLLGDALGDARRERDEARAEYARQAPRIFAAEEERDRLAGERDRVKAERDEARAEVERLRAELERLNDAVLALSFSTEP